MRSSRVLVYSGATADNASHYDVPASQTLVSVDFSMQIVSAVGASAIGRAFLSFNPTFALSEADMAIQNIMQLYVATKTILAGVAGYGAENKSVTIPGGLKLMTGDRIYLNVSTTVTAIVSALLNFE